MRFLTGFISNAILLWPKNHLSMILDLLNLFKFIKIYFVPQHKVYLIKHILQKSMYSVVLGSDVL